MSPHDRVPHHVLLASPGLDSRVPAGRVLEAVATGLQDGGAPAPDVCELPEEMGRGPALQTLLEELGFDARMRAARALVLAVQSLRESTLAGSAVFELATRARQGGVPCYAIAGENCLDDFDLRILDLQVVLEARTPRALTKAGKQLAGLV